MELQNYIFENPDYINKLKSDGFIVKNFNKYNLKLIKYPYDKEINTNSWERYCKGAIIDTTTNKLIVVPPYKSSILNIDDIEIDETCIIQELYDGTMINLFWHAGGHTSREDDREDGEDDIDDNQWLLSTRSDIGLNNKWSNKSFKQLFKECSTIDYNKLNKEYTYSFVMQHKENRNISIVNENCIRLVEVYNKSFEFVDIDTIEPNGFLIVANHKIDNLKNYIETSNINNFNTFSWKGFTIKKNGQRYNYLNELFEQVKQLKVNSNNPLYNYIELHKNNNIKNFLFYFGEYIDEFNKYRLIYDVFVKDLYKHYADIKINKVIEYKECPFQLKPLIYELHGIYLNDFKTINKTRVDEYVNNLDTKRLVFVVKYYI